MDRVTPLMDVTDRQRLLSTEEGQDDTDTVQSRVQYNRLPVGSWVIEWMGALSSLNPIKKRKL